MAGSENPPNGQPRSCLTIDVEDWYHILDSPAAPPLTSWPFLESRIERNVEALLEVLETYSVKVTFFWLGWLAKRHQALVHLCHNAGHEIASHGYDHVLAYEVGPQAFRQDIVRAKSLLEDMIAEPIRGFRAPGFGITTKAAWAFDVIREAGYQYDSSVFPASRGHGGIPDSLLGLYFVETRSGHLLEIPMSIVEVFGRRTSFFGGGYLRLASRRMIKWGIDRLQAAKQPLIVYVHPREIDPDQPRLPLSLMRQFKCYVNLDSTLPKLKWLCGNYRFYTMLEMVESYIRSFYLESKMIPVMRLAHNQAGSELRPTPEEQPDPLYRESFRSRLLLVERAMAGFLRVQAAPPQQSASSESQPKTPTPDGEVLLSHTSREGVV
jgi:polysaccharide deacetylase family protein (PEP-CTERM system associated)